MPVDLKGRLEVIVDVVAPDLKSSVQNYAALGRRYVAGADIDGRIVVGEYDRQAFQVRASSQTLLEIAQGSPRQSVLLAAMIADYQKATGGK